MVINMSKKTLTFILVSTFLLFWCNPSVAVIDDFQDAVDAYNRKDYKTSYKLIFPLAEKGFAQAQYNLGVMYEKGKGVKRNHKKAVKWFRLAAKQGLARAKEKLNIILKQKAKEKLNITLKQKAEEKLQEDSKVLIDSSLKVNVKIFRDGLNALNKKDYEVAHQLFLQLAEHGVAEAQYNFIIFFIECI